MGLTPKEHEKALLLGDHLVKLLTSESPLVAGFALAAVLKCMPPSVKEVFNFARERIVKALDRVKASN